MNFLIHGKSVQKDTYLVIGKTSPRINTALIPSNKASVEIMKWFPSNLTRSRTNFNDVSENKKISSMHPVKYQAYREVEKFPEMYREDQSINQ